MRPEEKLEQERRLREEFKDKPMEHIENVTSVNKEEIIKFFDGNVILKDRDGKVIYKPS
jgi:hypothetical protein